MRELEEKYADDLVVVGVHAGKFIAERVTANIRTASRRLGVGHPVVNDRQFRTWRAYNVQAWPTVVLVGPDGKYIGQHSGEITFEEFDPVIEHAISSYEPTGLLSRKPIHFAPDAATTDDSPILFPGKVLADATNDRLVIADTGHNRVLVAQVSRDETSAQVTEVIGSGEAGFTEGDFATCRLNKPEGLALRGQTLYIADTENHSIRAADLGAGTLTTIAGTGEQGYSRNGGVMPGVALNSPWDLLERDGWLYIAMAGTHQLWRMNLSSGEVRAFVGNGRENIDDGPNAAATLAQPSGLTTDGQKLYFADSESSAIRVADFAPEGYTQTLVGAGLFEFGDRDGKAMQARLEHCLGVAYHDGRVYIADTYSNKIKSLHLAAKEVTTVYGSGEPGELYEPGGLSVWAGNTGGVSLYVADTNNHRVLQLVIDSEGKLVRAVPLDLRTTG